MYFVASGIPVIIGQPLPVEGSEFVVDLLTKTFDEHFGATWAFEADPIMSSHVMIDHIDRRRAGLGLPGPMYEVPYAPKTEQGMGAGEAIAGAAMTDGAESCPGPTKIDD